MSERRRGEQSKTSSGLLFLLNHRAISILRSFQFIWLVEVPRLPDQTHVECKREVNVFIRLVNSDEGYKQLGILKNFSQGDILEETVMTIFNKVKPKLRNVWPDVIDDQEEALGTIIVHWVEREGKVL